MHYVYAHYHLSHLRSLEQKKGDLTALALGELSLIGSHQVSVSLAASERLDPWGESRTPVSQRSSLN